MRRLITIGITVLALLETNPAVAQDGSHFTATTDVAIGRDSGFLAHDQILTDTVIVIRPATLGFVRKLPRAEFTASYQPEIELFDNNRDLNALNHTGTAIWTFRISERVNFTAIDEALVTQDPTASRPGSLIFLPRQRFAQNRASVAVNYAMTHKSALTLGFDNVVASASLLNTDPEAGRVRSAGSVSLARVFGRKQKVTATYSLLNTDAHVLNVSYDSDLARNLKLHLSAGLLKDEGDSYLMSARLERRLRSISINGGFDRVLSIFGASLLGGAPIGNDLALPAGVSRAKAYEVISMGVSSSPSSRARIEVRAMATRSNADTANQYDNVSGRFKVDCSLTRRLAISSDLQFYNQSFNTFIGAAIDRRRYMAGVQFDMSPNPRRLSTSPSSPNQLRSLSSD